MPTRSWLESASLGVAEWHCPGAEVRVGGEEAPARHELMVARVGAHVRRAGGRAVVVEPGRLVTATAGEAFRPVFTVGAPSRCTVIALDDAALRGLLAERDPRAADAPRPAFPGDGAPLSPRAALTHARLVRETMLGGDPVALHELSLELAREGVGTGAGGSRRGAAGGGAGPGGRVSRRAAEAVDEVRRLLALRFAERLTLDRLAAAVELTPWHLNRVFRAVVGESVHRHLIRLRLLAALERMASGGGDLSRIAHDVGFASHSHFTAHFRRAFGRVPSAAFDAGGGRG